MKRPGRNFNLALLGCAFVVEVACQPARAQGTFTAPGQVVQTAQAGQALVFDPPSGVAKIVSIDAQNMLLSQLANGEYQLLTVRHVYSGGIARLFGGVTVPTAYFVSPAFNGNTFNGNDAVVGVASNPGGGVFSP
jgi:hypothetical protein